MNQSFKDKGCTTQCIDFRDLSYDKYLSPQTAGVIHPTDIDGFLEIRSTGTHPLRLPEGAGVYIFLEYKYADAPITLGQEMGLTALADAVCSGTENRAFVLDVSHLIKDVDKDIQAGASVVRRCYDGRERKWRAVKPGTTVRLLVNGIISAYRK